MEDAVKALNSSFTVVEFKMDPQDPRMNIRYSLKPIQKRKS